MVHTRVARGGCASARKWADHSFEVTEERQDFVVGFGAFPEARYESENGRHCKGSFQLSLLGSLVTLSGLLMNAGWDAQWTARYMLDGSSSNPWDARRSVLQELNEMSMKTESYRF